MQIAIVHSEKFQKYCFYLAKNWYGNAAIEDQQICSSAGTARCARGGDYYSGWWVGLGDGGWEVGGGGVRHGSSARGGGAITSYAQNTTMTMMFSLLLLFRSGKSRSRFTTADTHKKTHSPSTLSHNSHRAACRVHVLAQSSLAQPSLAQPSVASLPAAGIWIHVKASKKN